MNRRSMLGGLVGGIAAGPSAVNVAAQSLARGAGGSTDFAYASNAMSVGKSIGHYDEAASLAKRLADHRANASKTKAQQRVERSRENDAADIAALRSVSPRHKTRMFIDRQIDRDHRLEEHWLLRRLREMQEGES